MEQKRIEIWNSGEYDYPHAFGFVPNLHTYLHEDDEIRPFFLVVPGGGYAYCSENEGEIVARTFYEKGYQAAVLTYTTNPLSMVPLHEQPLKDIARAVRMIRAKKDEFRTFTDRIIICGFSAGAHVCGTLAEYHDTVADSLYPEVSAAPDRTVLCYPVITMGEYAHKGSVATLLGSDASAEDIEKMSLEKNVRDDMCPVFLWQTMEDKSVPVENSYLMAMALKKKNIPFAHHVFTHGAHGLSVANQDLCDRKYANPYTLDQVFALMDAIRNGSFVPEDPNTEKALDEKFSYRKDPNWRDASRKPNPDAARWVELCASWLETSFEQVQETEITSV